MFSWDTLLSPSKDSSTICGKSTSFDWGTIVVHCNYAMGTKRIPIAMAGRGKGQACIASELDEM